MDQQSTLDSVKILVQAFIVFAPLIGYISQYKLIESKRSLGTFSTNVCLILLVSNTLRVFFWFGVFYEIALLIQSIVMIGMQFILIKKCVEVKSFQLISDKNKKFLNNPLSHFWAWTDFNSYLSSIIAFTLFIGSISLALKDSKSYWEFIGLLSGIIEASLGMPQVSKNYKSKSTKGLSYMMILTWILGDSFKTVYFFITRAPQQFLLCGVVQLVMDAIIVLQIAFYNKQQTFEL